MQRKYMELNWEGLGYHSFPVAPGPGGYVSAEEATAWSGFELVLAAAKRGDFSGAKRLLKIYTRACLLHLRPSPSFHVHLARISRQGS
jgi:hypothetical protein